MTGVECRSSVASSRQLLVAMFLFVSSLSVDSSSFGPREDSVQWQILTMGNFSSQIRLHPHVLLLVTVPWSGESRSLMKELAYAVTYKQEKFGDLKLMLINRNSEKMLADVLGATDEITILCYHHFVSYKYQGRLRAQNILSSAHFLASRTPEELPFKTLNTQEEMETFLESTDKAILLLEFCGWTHRLLAKSNNNVTENAIGVSGGIFVETHQTHVFKEGKNEKGMENENLSCGIESEFTGTCPVEFSSINSSVCSLETWNKESTVELSCKLEEFQRFDSFFSKFLTATREFFLPPERQRFGLVSEKSLLSSLGIGDSGPWLVMLYFVGCPSCSKILSEGDDLKAALQMHNSFVMELKGDGHYLEPALLANKPSILLFVDRSSESSKIRKKSKVALDVFRELVLHNHLSYEMAGQNDDNPEKSSVEALKMLRNGREHPRLELSQAMQKIMQKDKMSIMIINDLGHAPLDNIALDLQGSSMPEILAYLLQQKKAKLSSLAKEVGFQLLSDDFEIKIGDLSPSHAEPGESIQNSPKLPLESLVHELPSIASLSAVDRKEQSKHNDALHSSQYDKEKKPNVDSSEGEASMEADKCYTNDEVCSAGDVKVEQASLSEVNNFDKLWHWFQDFKGSFFFSDGGYQLLKALTGGVKIPSLVIVDPSSQKHYVFPEEMAFSYSSVSDFLDGFLDGSLLPCQRSESFLLNPREAAHPPFVNLDFHEVDSIPRVSTHMFPEMVLGSNQSDIQKAGHAWKKDVLVLFSSSWCGFCQRMELVVREVYRALKDYTNMLKTGSWNGEFLSTNGNLDELLLKLPLIYLMDCTLNDCGLILKPVAQSELYPYLLLFPAEKKNAVLYEGDISVANIIRFIADHGRASRHLIGEKGILWTEANKGFGNQHLLETVSPMIDEETSNVKNMYHEVILKNRTPKKAVKYHKIRSHSSKDLHDEAPRVIVGSVLLASDKLLGVQPFDKSIILIVKVDQGVGFQGLILNKHISWSSLDELEEGLELLKKAPLSLGGPFIKRGMPLIALIRRAVKDQYPEVLPGIYFLDESATAKDIDELKSGNQSVTDYWFFLGYSRWSWDQLFDEISEGAWNVSINTMGYFSWP